MSAMGMRVGRRSLAVSAELLHVHEVHPWRDNVAPDFNIAGALVEPEVARAQVPREQLESVRCGAGVLDGKEQTGAQSATLKRWVHAEPSDVAGAAVLTAADRPDDFPISTQDEEAMGGVDGTEIGDRLGQRRQGRVLIALGLALIADSLQGDDCRGVRDPGLFDCEVHRSVPWFTASRLRSKVR